MSWNGINGSLNRSRYVTSRVLETRLFLLSNHPPKCGLGNVFALVPAAGRSHVLRSRL